MSAMSPPEIAGLERLLVTQACSGSESEREAAFASLYERYRKGVYCLAYHMTGSQAEAEDATQETFLAVFSGLSGFRVESRLSTWIYRIAVRVILRARSGASGQQAVRDDLPDPRSEAETACREQRQRLEKALARLSVEHRTVLSLFAIDELSHREIAHLLGIPEGTVWSRLHAARKRLSEDLTGPAVAPKTVKQSRKG